MSSDKLSSIEKAIVILELLSEPPYEYKVSDISQITGINRTTTYRILDTLESKSMVIRDIDSDKYKIGPTTYHFGVSYLNNYNYESKVQEILNEISELTKESVGLAIKDGDKIISLFEIEIHQPMKFNDIPGKFYDVNKGTYGKCIMAYQDEGYIKEMLEDRAFEKLYPNTITEKEELLKEYDQIRKQGYATSIDEVGVDVCGVGVPLFDSKRRIKACVAVAFFKTDSNYIDKIMEFKTILLSYQKKLEKYFP